MEGRTKTIRQSRSDRIFDVVNITLLSLLLIIVIYPLIYVLSCSFSDPLLVVQSKIKLLPQKVTLVAYQRVFRNELVMSGYKNTFIYTILGTTLNVIITTMTAYPLSRKDFAIRKPVTVLVTFTMLFSGGMIPTYILVRGLGMINTVWAMIIPGALSVYNMIITRTFLQTNVPGELLEASQIDGCSDFRYFFSVVLPLSKAVIAVITLYYAVGHWNSYFNAFLYLSDQKLYPLQIVLRDILLANSFDASLIVDEELAAAKQGLADLLKYSLMVVSSLPVIIMYPFVQKYFIEGVLIGSIKG